MIYNAKKALLLLVFIVSASTLFSTNLVYGADSPSVAVTCVASKVRVALGESVTYTATATTNVTPYHVAFSFNDGVTTNYGVSINTPPYTTAFTTSYTTTGDKTMAIRATVAGFLGVFADVTCDPVAVAPTIALTCAVSKSQVVIGESVTFTATATLNDGERAGVAFGFNDGERAGGSRIDVPPYTNTISKSYSAVGDKTMTVRALDIHFYNVYADTVCGTVTVSATHTPVAPVSNAGVDQVITLPTNSVTLNGSGSTDSDGTIASYVWAWVSGPSNINPADTVSPTVSGLVAGTYIFQLTVTDNSGLTGTDTVQITVNPASSTPSIALTCAVSKNQITIGEDVTYTATATTNVTPYHIAFSFNDGVTTNFGANVATPPYTKSFTTSYSTAGDKTMAIRATAAGFLGVFADVTCGTVKVVTTPVLAAPTANAGSDQVIILPTSSATLDGSASTASTGTITSYVWSFISGPSNINPADTVSSTVSNLVAGTYVFQLTVTNSSGLTGTDTVQITVNPTAPPAVPPPTIGGAGGGTPSGGIPPGTTPPFVPIGISSPVVPPPLVAAVIASTPAPVTPVSPNVCIKIQKYMRLGAANDPVEVKKVQNFLRRYAGATNVQVTGIYDMVTFNAVEEFQKKYTSEVLSPWNASQPTGYLYITTRKKINEILCAPREPFTLQESAIIAAYRQRLATALANAGTSNVATTALPSPTISAEERKALTEQENLTIDFYRRQYEAAVAKVNLERGLASTTGLEEYDLDVAPSNTDGLLQTSLLQTSMSAAVGFWNTVTGGVSSVGEQTARGGERLFKKVGDFFKGFHPATKN